MNVATFTDTNWLARAAISILVGSMLGWLILFVFDEVRVASLIGVGHDSEQHLGEKFQVSQVFVDDYHRLYSGREGDSSRFICCLLPKKWKPGLEVEVRWSINEWSNEEWQKPQSTVSSVQVAGTAYIARVPVERYETATHLWIHFFNGGKVRVVSSEAWPENRKHPIQHGDPHAADRATVGKAVSALFTNEEVAAMEKWDQTHRPWFGDWR